MKLRDVKEAHTKTDVELNKLLKDAYASLMRKKLDLSLAALKNTSQLRTLRHEIAVIKTVKNKKKLAERKEK